MKKTFAVIITAVLLSAFIVSVVVFTGGKNVFPPIEGSEDSVMLLNDSLTIEKHETYELFLVNSADKSVSWRSDNESAATVENGIVSANSRGFANIIASVGETELVCKIMVVDSGLVPLLSIGDFDGGINMTVAQNYLLNPVISYNGRNYDDAVFSYSTNADVISVSSEGRISAIKTGDAIVSVNCRWRGESVTETLSVSVVDLSTSIEIGGESFEVFVNGNSVEFPESLSTGVTVFDEGVKVEKPIVSYREVALVGDTSGVADITDGNITAVKVGSCHFVADYTSVSGATVSSAIFSVTVSRSPADIYTTPIKGEDFLFFFHPLGEDNSVEWDNELLAFHLINNVAEGSDSRALIMDNNYIKDVIRYNVAESISFEYKDDGKKTGLSTDDQGIYRGFYPSWWDSTGVNMKRTALSSEWTKVEIPLDSIPYDSKGNLKSPFIMNTVGGLYIRNVLVNLPVVWSNYTTVDFLGGNMTWTHGNDTGLTGGNNVGELTYSDGDAEHPTLATLNGMYAYSTHKIQFTSSIDCTSAMKMRIYLKATPSAEGMRNIEMRIYGLTATGSIGGDIKYLAATISKQGEWMYVDYELKDLLDQSGKFKGFSFAVFGYNDWNSGEKYTVDFDCIEILEPDRT